MPATLRLYSPLGIRPLAGDISSDLITMSYAEAPYGSLAGTAQIEVTDSNRALLESLDECSHYLKVSSSITSSTDGLVGGVVKACYIDRGVAYLSMMGFLEYMELVQMIASHKANSMTSAVSVAKEDPSWTKIIYADSNLGLFWEVFKNLESTMRIQNWNPFFTMVGIKELIESTPVQGWDKSYRINSLEIPNMAQAYSDLVDDTEFLPVRVSVNTGDNFIWILSAITSYSLTVIDEAKDLVKDVAIEQGDRLNRAFSLASGSDPDGNNLASRVEFSPTAVYSSAFTDTPAKSALDISRASRATIAGASRRVGQITFTSWDPSLEIYSAVRIQGQYLDPIEAVIVEKAIDGQSVVYTATIVTSVSDLIPGVTKATSEARRLIYDPAKRGNRRSIRLGLQKENPTGWR